jgi:hypothetical protein
MAVNVPGSLLVKLTDLPSGRSAECYHSPRLVCFNQKWGLIRLLPATTAIGSLPI